MIRQVKGKVLSIEASGTVVEVAGFGVFIHTHTPEAIKVGGDATFTTHLAVNQNGMELYGFLDPADRDFFELALSVSGVGPKTALALLRKAPREKLSSAIARRDINYLTRVAGLGKKSAEKLAVELSEKIGLDKKSLEGEDTEVLDTLIALGYTEREARKALAGVPESVAGKEARLRSALSGNGR